MLPLTTTTDRHDHGEVQKQLLSAMRPFGKATSPCPAAVLLIRGSPSTCNFTSCGTQALVNRHCVLEWIKSSGEKKCTRQQTPHTGMLGSRPLPMTALAVMRYTCKFVEIGPPTKDTYRQAYRTTSAKDMFPRRTCFVHLTTVYFITASCDTTKFFATWHSCPNS